MDHARTGRALLALCGPRWSEAEGLSADEWRMLGAMAEQHRLQPFLHNRLARGEIEGVPGELADAWREAHRRNAIAMLGQRRALLEAVAILGENTIGAVALKGSALAWTVWPEPAMREMRDIDLLVAEENAARGYMALRDAGWEAPELDEAALRAFAAEETHLPALRSPDGVMCELHAHAWGKSPLPGSTMPASDDAGMLARARYSEALGAAIPSREDLLAHLVVHAACSHLLNVGPVALFDIDLLCARRPIDWPAFWRRARGEGFEKPAALLFALVDRWRMPGFLEASFCEALPESALLDEAELLLVQDLDARKDVSVIASLASGQLSGRTGQHALDRAEEAASLPQRIGQLGSRAASLGRSLFTPQTRRAGLATGRLQKWMEG